MKLLLEVSRSCHHKNMESCELLKNARATPSAAREPAVRFHSPSGIREINTCLRRRKNSGWILARVARGMRTGARGLAGIILLIFMVAGSRGYTKYLQPCNQQEYNYHSARCAKEGP